MSAKDARDESGSEATMDVMILYDEFSSATKAKAILERATHRSDETMQWRVKLWRSDMLKLPPAADAALVEAAGAHLIVLALGMPKFVSAPLLGWLEKWAALRQVHDAALALFDGANPDVLSAPGAPDLRQFAQRHDLGFIFDARDQAGDESSTLADGLHDREVSSTPTLRQILEQPVSGDYQHWGINE